MAVAVFSYAGDWIPTATDRNGSNLHIFCDKALSSLGKRDCTGVAHVLACGAAGAQTRIHDGLLILQSYSITMADPLAAATAVAQFRLDLRAHILDRQVVSRGDCLCSQVPKVPVRMVAVPGHELLDVLKQSG